VGNKFAGQKRLRRDHARYESISMSKNMHNPVSLIPNPGVSVFFYATLYLFVLKDA
jgi:hypothetical protein